MKKITLLLIAILFTLSAGSQNVKDRLMNSGAWFLFSTRIEQQEGNKILTQVQFFKKEDVSSLLFDKKNRLYSVFSDSGKNVNEDLWKLLSDTTFVISDLEGKAMQIMEIIELSKNKLVIRYCDDSIENSSKCIISTYFSTKKGWLSDQEIDELNTAGILELKEVES